MLLAMTYSEGFKGWYTSLSTQAWCQKSFLAQYILSSIHCDKVVCKYAGSSRLKKCMNPP